MLRAALARFDEATRRAPREDVLAVSAICVVVYAIVKPFLVARYPPMTDLPFHAAQSSVYRHYLDPSFHFHEQFVLQPFAVPYMSMYAIGAALMLVMPALAATKIAAALMIALVPAGLAVMFHGMKKSPLLGLLGLGVAWCDLTQRGFLNFMGALGLFAMAVGFTLMLLDAPTRGRQIALGATLVALFFTHVFRFPFAMAAVVGTAIVMYPATKRWKPIVAPLVPAAVLMALWLAVRPKALVGDVGPVEIHAERLGNFFGVLGNSFLDPAEAIAEATFARVAVAVAVACIGVAVVSARRGAPRRQSVAWTAGVTVIPIACAAVFLGLFLVLPMQLGAWWYVFPREATATVFIVFGAFPDLPRAFWLRAPLALALGVAGIGIASVVVTNYARFDAAAGDFDAIVAQIPQAPKLCYLIFEEGGSTRTSPPFMHMPAYVQADKGGWLSFHFAVWGASPLGYRPRDEPGAVVPPPVPPRWEWKPQLFDVREQGPFFDWFLVRQVRAPDAVFAADPTIERVDHKGAWWLYRRRPGAAPPSP